MQTRAQPALARGTLSSGTAHACRNVLVVGRVYELRPFCLELAVPVALVKVPLEAPRVAPPASMDECDTLCFRLSVP